MKRGTEGGVGRFQNGGLRLGSGLSGSPEHMLMSTEGRIALSLHGVWRKVRAFIFPVKSEKAVVGTEQNIGNLSWSAIDKLGAADQALI